MQNKTSGCSIAMSPVSQAGCDTGDNQKSLPKGSRPSDRMVGEYEAILQRLKTVRSKYVTIREPPQQPESTATPSQALGRGINNHPYTF